MEYAFQLDTIAPGATVQAPFLPEPVRVLTFVPLNEQTFRLEAVGIQSQRFYSRLLTHDQANQLQVLKEIWDLAGQPEAVFLALEADRIRSAVVGPVARGMRSFHVCGI